MRWTPIVVSMMVVAGCGRSKPPAAPAPKAPNQVPTDPKSPSSISPAEPVTPATAAPIGADSLGCIALPGDPKAGRAWLKQEGCVAAAEDGSAALCWRSEAQGEQTTLSLVQWRAPGVEADRWQVYRGPSSWSKEAINEANVRAVCAWMQSHKASQGKAMKPPVNVSHNQVTVAWGPRQWAMPLRQPPAMAPTTKLSGREVLCCRPKPRQATHFGAQGVLVLELRYDCSWRRKPASDDDVCADTAWDGQLTARPNAAVYFVPVGPAQ